MEWAGIILYQTFTVIFKSFEDFSPKSYLDMVNINVILTLSHAAIFVYLFIYLFIYLFSKVDLR